MENCHQAGESRGNRRDLRRLKTQTEPHRNGHHGAKQTGRGGVEEKQKQATKQKQTAHTHTYTHSHREEEEGVRECRRFADFGQRGRGVLIPGCTEMAEDAGYLINRHPLSKEAAEKERARERKRVRQRKRGRGREIQMWHRGRRSEQGKLSVNASPARQDDWQVFHLSQS